MVVAAAVSAKLPQPQFGKAPFCLQRIFSCLRFRTTRPTARWMCQRPTLPAGKPLPSCSWSGFDVQTTPPHLAGRSRTETTPGSGHRGISWPRVARRKVRKVMRNLLVLLWTLLTLCPNSAGVFCQEQNGIFPVITMLDERPVAIFVDINGEQITDRSFDLTGDCYSLVGAEFCFAATPDGKWFRIERHNIEPLPALSGGEIEDIFRLGYRTIAETLEKQFVLNSMDKTWNELPFRVDLGQDFSNQDLHVASKDALRGYVDSQLKVRIDFEYQIAKPFRNGRAFVKKDDKCFFIDKQQNKYFESTTYYKMLPLLLGFPEYENGVTIGLVENRLRFVDSSGEIWDGLSEDLFPRLSFDRGLAICCNQSGKLCLIDKTGRRLSDNWFDYLGRHHDGIANGVLDGTPCLVDRNGNVIEWLDESYNEFGVYKFGRILVRSRDKTAMLDGKGRVIRQWELPKLGRPI